MIETSSLKENKYRETVKQQILKIRDTKVIIGFGDFLIFCLMVGADAAIISIFFIGDKTFTTFTIPAFVFGGVDMIL